MKSFTSLEQSKKLAEILPNETADMCWILVGYGDEAGSRHEPSLATYKTGSHFRDRIFPKDHTIPCWSLAALLSLIHIEHNLHDYLTENGMEHRIETLYAGNSKSYDNPVDACVDMIIKLKELKML